MADQLMGDYATQSGSTRNIPRPHNKDISHDMDIQIHMPTYYANVGVPDQMELVKCSKKMVQVREVCNIQSSLKKTLHQHGEAPTSDERLTEEYDHNMANHRPHAKAKWSLQESKITGTIKGGPAHHQQEQGNNDDTKQRQKLSQSRRTMDHPKQREETVTYENDRNKVLHHAPLRTLLTMPPSPRWGKVEDSRSGEGILVQSKSTV